LNNPWAGRARVPRPHLLSRGYPSTREPM
jgi:hypothetical protein